MAELLRFQGELYERVDKKFEPAYSPFPRSEEELADMRAAHKAGYDGNNPQQVTYHKMMRQFWDVKHQFDKLYNAGKVTKTEDIEIEKRAKAFIEASDDYINFGTPLSKHSGHSLKDLRIHAESTLEQYVREAQDVITLAKTERHGSKRVDSVGSRKIDAIKKLDNKYTIGEVQEHLFNMGYEAVSLLNQKHKLDRMPGGYDLVDRHKAVELERAIEHVHSLIEEIEEEIKHVHGGSYRSFATGDLDDE